MEAAGPLPSVGHTISRISTLIRTDAGSAELAEVLLQDYSLTQRVLRMANSAMYRTIGGEITGVKSAISVLGLDAVSYLVMHSTLAESIKDPILKEEASASLARAELASSLAKDLAKCMPSLKKEDAALYALLSNTGRMLVTAFLPVEWATIQAKVALFGLSEPAAVASVLGASFEELGLKAAKAWNLPGRLSSVFNHENSTADDSEERLYLISEGANGVVSLLGSDNLDYAEVAGLIERLASDLKLPTGSFSGLVAAIATPEVVGRLNPVAARVVSPETRIAAGLDMLSSAKESGATLRIAQAALGCQTTVLFGMDTTGHYLVPKIWRGVSDPTKLVGVVLQANSKNLPGLALGKDKVIFISKAITAKSHMPEWHESLFPGDKSYVLLPSGNRTLLYSGWSSEKESVDDSQALIRAIRQRLLSP